MHLLLIIVLSLFSCASPKPDERESPDALIKSKYIEAITRLQSNHLENGWVVSRTIEGDPEHQGEGLLWSGLWLSAAPCGEASETSIMLRDMVMRHKGGLVRVEPLGEYEGGREITLDGALGLYRGIAEEIMRCGLKGDWYEPTLAHLNYVTQNSGKLNENAKAELIKEFTYILDLLAYRLSIRSEPSTDRLRMLEAQVTSWAAAVTSSHAAAYRIHLGFIALETVERLGKKVNWGPFCLASKGADIPLVEHKCGRSNLEQEIESFQYNIYEERNQRGKWEKPDCLGDICVGLDLIRWIGAAYNVY